MVMDNPDEHNYNRVSDASEAEIPPWYIEKPEVFEADDLRYLCHNCRHIDLATMTDMKGRRVDANLGPMSEIVRKQNCALCRLILRTVCIADGVEVPSLESEYQEIYYKVRSMTRRRGQNNYSDSCALALIRSDHTASQTNYLIQRLSDVPFEGRKLSATEADYDWIKREILLCEREISGLRLEEHESQTRMIGTFRIIDVKDQCLREVPHRSCRYVALSYVWGRVKQLHCTKANREELEQPNGLTKHEVMISQTIKDAMTLVSRIDERYLWVDCLCIIQDDEDFKQTQIASMDRIYSHAVLTIANAAGNSADDRIPGVTTGSRSLRQHIEEIQGSQFSNLMDGLGIFSDYTKWNTRAWTYQERALSKRTLLITDRGMCFDCMHEVFPEDNNSTHGATPIKQPSQGPIIGNASASVCPQPFYQNNNLVYINNYAYCQALHSYTMRSMSYWSDSLNAFAGIMARLRPLFRSNFICGLPETELDLALLWKPYGTLVRNVDRETGRSLFPSWSWAGWVGTKSRSFNWSQEALSRVMWRNFAVKDGPGEWFSSNWCRRAADSSITDWKLSHGYYYQENEPDILFPHPITPEYTRTPIEWFSSPNSHQIELRTLVASFYVNGAHSPQVDVLGKNIDCAHESCTVHVFDSNGRIAGTVNVPSSTLRFMLLGRYDFLLLSRSYLSMFETHHQSKRTMPDDFPIDFDESDRYAAAQSAETFKADVAVPSEEVRKFSSPNVSKEDARYIFDKTRYDADKPWCVYNVMLVEWKERVAYRLGLGRVHIDAFFEAQPRMSHVALG